MSPPTLPSSYMRSSFALFLISSALLSLAALIQQKGWSYQFYPVALFLLLAAAIALGRDELEYTIRGPRGAAAVFLIALAVTYHTILFMRVGYSSHGPTANVAALMQTFERYAGEDQSVFAFITSPRDIHPAVLASGRAWAGRSGVLMYLPAALNMRKAASPETAQIRTVARRHNRNRIARLLKLRPAVIAFDNRKDKLGIRDPSFDYLEYYGRFPCFRRLMRAYTQVRSVVGFRIFRRRNGMPTNVADSVDQIRCNRLRQSP